GRKVRLPIVGREIPVIADVYVDPTFGTGALKITPGHDFNDFEIGQKYRLPVICIFDGDARIRAAAFAESGREPAWVERYKGKDVSAAPKPGGNSINQEALLKKTEPYRLALARCYRCQTPVEPYLTPQWFVKIKPLAEPAMEVVRDARVKIIPEGWANS